MGAKSKIISAMISFYRIDLKYKIGPLGISLKLISSYNIEGYPIRIAKQTYGVIFNRII